jgi:hypothetical protein
VKRINFNTVLPRLAFLLPFLVAASIPMAIKIHHVIVAFTLLVFVIIIDWKEFFKSEFIRTTVFRLLILQFLIVVVGLTYTLNLTEGVQDLERSLYLIISLLLIFGCQRLGHLPTDILNGFSIGNLALAAYGIFLLVTNSISNSLNVFDEGYAFFSEHMLIHPLYLSTYLILVFFFLAEKLRTQWHEMPQHFRYLNFAGIVSALAVLILLRAQVSLIIFPILLVVYMVVILKKRGWFVAYAFVTIFFLTFLFDNHRIKTYFDIYGKNISTALDQRISVWTGTLQGIMISPLLGAGTGGDQDLINRGYEKIGYQEGILNSFNAHNQYLQFIARNGILELACFLTLLGYSFWRSLQLSNYTFLMFNMLVSLVMFTESFLVVQKGISFYYFFVCAFLCLTTEREPVKK